MSNREIKFRMWDIPHKTFLPIDTYAVITTDFKAFGVMLKDWEEYKEGEYAYSNCQVLEQYTGLKDRNGVEIYEGDILGGHPHGTIQVKWSDEWACFESVSIENTFDIDGETIEQEIGSLFVNDLKDCFNEWSVIGNIHQNPELL